MDPQPIDILLVEDNPDHVELILKALQDNNVLNQVHVVTDGEEALRRLAEEEAYDLVLTDVVMPEIGGKELIRELRKMDPGLKALAITGHVLAEDLEELKGGGHLRHSLQAPRLEHLGTGHPPRPGCRLIGGHLVEVERLVPSVLTAGAR